MKTVAFYTLGCKLNFSETSSISRTFEEQGFTKVEFSEIAEIYVINTCSVTENADKKCKKLVRDIKKKAPESYVIIIGCYAQLKPQEIAAIHGVDGVLGANEKFNLIKTLGSFKKGKAPIVIATDIDIVEDYHSSYSINDRTRLLQRTFTCSMKSDTQASLYISEIVELFCCISHEESNLMIKK